MKARELRAKRDQQWCWPPSRRTFPDGRTHGVIDRLRTRLVDQCHPAFVHALLEQKSSSVRAMTSTIALPMPRTSKRAVGMMRRLFLMRTNVREAHYSGRPLQGKTGSWHVGRRERRRGVRHPSLRRLGMAVLERVFSGVQPTGNLHLGNYLGAIKRFVELQDRYDCIYCVVDLHAITVWQDPAELPNDPRGDGGVHRLRDRPAKHIVFNQSQVRARRTGLDFELRGAPRLAQPDDAVQGKGRQGRENASVGLYAYPALMAADILVYALPMCRWARTRNSISSCRATSRRNSTTISPIPSMRRLRRGVLPAAGAGDHRRGDAGHVVARRHEENVEVGPFRLFPHQPHR